jgi:hypothetical protein
VALPHSEHPNIRKALEVIRQAEGPVCFDCLGLAPKDEVELLVEFAVNTPPRHRIVEDFCTSCAKRKRVVRKVRSYP